MANGTYSSAHGAPQFSPLGKFAKFTVNVSADHVAKGYWRFTVEADGEDDLRAHNNGFKNPEEVLAAALNDETSRCDRISITWYPGELDKWLEARKGTVSQHLERITKERQALGISASFRGQTPTYPIDRDGKLFGMRQAHDATPKVPTTLQPGGGQISSQEPSIAEEVSFQLTGLKLLEAKSTLDDTPPSQTEAVLENTTNEVTSENTGDQAWDEDVCPPRDAVPFFARQKDGPPCFLCGATEVHVAGCFVAEFILESYEPWEKRKSNADTGYKEWRKDNPRPASPPEKRKDETDGKRSDALTPGQIWDVVDYMKRHPGPYEQCGEDHCTGSCLRKGH